MATWAGTITERLNEISGRFERGMSRFARIDLRLGGVDETMLQMSAKLATMNTQLSIMATQITHIDECADKARVSVEKWMKNASRRHDWSPFWRVVAAIWSNKWPAFVLTFLFAALMLKFVGGMPIHIQFEFALKFIEGLKALWGSI